MATRKNLYTRPLFQYTPRVLNMEDKSVLYKEYSRLRGIAMRRISRREEAGYTKYYTPNLPTVAELKSGKGSVVYSLIRTVRFLESAVSTVSGIKKQEAATVKSLNEKGYRFITRKNLSSYASMMRFIDSIVSEGIRYMIISTGERIAVFSPDYYKRWFEAWQNADEGDKEKKVREVLKHDLQLEGIQL